PAAPAWSLSLPDALPISRDDGGRVVPGADRSADAEAAAGREAARRAAAERRGLDRAAPHGGSRGGAHGLELHGERDADAVRRQQDRKSTRLNSSHVNISY